jgi:hypothetical protein
MFFWLVTPCGLVTRYRYQRFGVYPSLHGIRTQNFVIQTAARSYQVPVVRPSLAITLRLNGVSLTGDICIYSLAYSDPAELIPKAASTAGGPQWVLRLVRAKERAYSWRCLSVLLKDGRTVYLTSYHWSARLLRREKSEINYAHLTRNIKETKMCDAKTARHFDTMRRRGTVLRAISGPNRRTLRSLLTCTLHKYD